MTALLLLFPAYLFANLHCFGMCGPIAMMLSRLKYRHSYLLGRVLGFTLAGALAGLTGSLFLDIRPVTPYFSLFLAFFLFLIGLLTLLHIALPLPALSRLSGKLASLALQDAPRPLFLFGLSTLLLPCGQTLVVLSASALFQSAPLGALNGLLFSLLTTPSLFIAMKAASLLQPLKKYTLITQALFAWGVGLLALLRAMAEWGVIEHWTLHSNWHLTLF